MWLGLLERAVVGCVLAGALCGLLGVFIVRLNLSSIGYCMSHAAFAGAALGFLLSQDPLLVALAFASATAALLGPVADKAKINIDAVTGVAFSLNMALAFVFINLIPGQGPLTREVVNILWGSVMAVSVSDLVYLAVVALATSVYVALFWKELMATLFNRKLAEADGIDTKLCIYPLVFLTGFVVTLSLKLVGGLLVFAMLFNPASAALQFANDIKRVVVAAPVIGALSCLAGLGASLAVDWPTGSCIVIASTLLFAAGVVLSPKRRRGVEGV